ncbi:MAG: DUF2203 domain-containing protein [Ignavibacteria bacterium]|nr:DUF2203 domain-containing protein [Ignavibacteria bacterium]
MLHKIHFTLESARIKVIELKDMLQKLVTLKKKLDESGYDVYRHEYFGGAGPNGTGKFPKDMEDLVVIVKEISKYGILIKSLDTGLIDFPCIRKTGEEVYLCYLLGEDTIKYWHSIEEGFAGRKNIEEL